MPIDSGHETSTVCTRRITDCRRATPPNKLRRTGGGPSMGKTTLCPCIKRASCNLHVHQTSAHRSPFRVQTPNTSRSVETGCPSPALHIRSFFCREPWQPHTEGACAPPHCQNFVPSSSLATTFFPLLYIHQTFEGNTSRGDRRYNGYCDAADPWRV